MNKKKITMKDVNGYLEFLKELHEEWNDVCAGVNDQAIEKLKALKGTVLVLPHGNARVHSVDFYCHSDGGHVYIYLIYIDALNGRYNREMKSSELRMFKQMLQGVVAMDEFLAEVDEDLASMMTESIRVAVDWEWIMQLIDSTAVRVNVANGDIAFTFK